MARQAKTTTTRRVSRFGAVITEIKSRRRRPELIKELSEDDLTNSNKRRNNVTEESDSTSGMALQAEPTQGYSRFIILFFL